jgi:thiamine pyrophosphokinase
MTAYVILGKNVNLKTYPFEKGSLLIGADRGSLEAVKAGLRLNLAYGDFDSVTAQEYQLILSGSDKVIKLNPVKNITDTYGAYQEAKKAGADKIVILGGIQGARIEHLFAIISILKEDPEVSLEDDNSTLQVLGCRPKEYAFKRSAFRFFSFFALEPSQLTLEGFRYPLKDYELQPDDSLCISNEIVPGKNEGLLTLQKGRILAVSSKDDHPLN